MVKEGMMTQPGVHMEDINNAGLVMECCLRWTLHQSLAYTYRGDHFKEGKELEPYLDDPKGRDKKTLPCRLVIWDHPDLKFKFKNQSPPFFLLLLSPVFPLSRLPTHFPIHNPLFCFLPTLP